MVYFSSSLYKLPSEASITVLTEYVTYCMCLVRLISKIPTGNSGSGEIICTKTFNLPTTPIRFPQISKTIKRRLQWILKRIWSRKYLESQCLYLVSMHIWTSSIDCKEKWSDEPWTRFSHKIMKSLMIKRFDSSLLTDVMLSIFSSLSRHHYYSTK